MKHVTSDAGIYIAHDWIKDLNQTAAQKNSCLDILINANSREQKNKETQISIPNFLPGEENISSTSSAS